MKGIKNPTDVGNDQGVKLRQMERRFSRVRRMRRIE